LLNNFKANTTGWDNLYALDQSTLRAFVANGYQVELKAESKAAPAKAQSKPYAVSGSTAVIPFVGVIAKYADDQGRTVSALETQIAIDAAASDDAIESIVLFIDSPGGTVAGTADLAARISVVKATKPITAYVSDNCCSAAYWVASQCSSVIANEAAKVGSIGVFCVLTDTSEAAAKAGIAVRLVAAGEYKGLDSQGLPITDKAIDSHQQIVNSTYDLFVQSISKGRNLSLPVVKQLADGRTHIASEALTLKLIDGIGTLDIAIQLNGETNTMASNVKVKADDSTPDAPAAPASDDVLKQIMDAITALTAKVDALSKDNDDDESDSSTDSEDVEGDDGADDMDAKVAKAVAADRDRLKAINESCGNRAEFAVAQFLAGKSPVEAKAALADVLTNENSSLRKAVAKGSDGIEPLALGGPSEEANASDPETIWAKNVGDVQKAYSGRKDYFLAAMKHTKKLNGGAK
jgi:signal peptide peptidase SppA